MQLSSPFIWRLVSRIQCITFTPSRAPLISYAFSSLSPPIASNYFRDKKGVNLEYVLGCSLTSTEPERAKFIEALTCSGERYRRPMLSTAHVHPAFVRQIFEIYILIKTKTSVHLSLFLLLQAS